MSVLARRTYKAADDRREQILDCALRVFAERGYHGSSIADVCARAGIGRATLYQHFEDKRDVLVALADRIERQVDAAIAMRAPLRAPAGVRPADVELVAFVALRVAHVFAAVFDQPDATRLVLRAGRGADGVVDDLLARLDAKIVAVVRADLDAAIEMGFARAVDVAIVARLFVGGLEKLVLSALDEGRAVDAFALARAVAEVELLGVLAAAPARAADDARRHVKPPDEKQKKRDDKETRR
jgi:AcrR family transcriptional regulator